MRRKGLWLRVVALAGLAICVGAGAGPVSFISVDGNLNDWGVATPTLANGNNWGHGQGTAQVEDSNDLSGNSGSVGPGIGGQNFDAEAMYTGFDVLSNTLYVAFVTGFDITGETDSSSRNYFAGDVFIDFGYTGPHYDPAGSYNYNGTNILNSGHTWDLAFILGANPADSVPTATTGLINAVTSPFPNLDQAPTDNPGYLSGPLQVGTGATPAGTANFAYTNDWGGYDHNVYEFSYALDPNNLLHANWIANMTGLGSGWTVHWTMSCGNDVLNLHSAAVPATTPGDPLVPIPAAAPMVLLGMGAIGLVRRFRRNKQS